MRGAIRRPGSAPSPRSVWGACTSACGVQRRERRSRAGRHGLRAERTRQARSARGRPTRRSACRRCRRSSAGNRACRCARRRAARRRCGGWRRGRAPCSGWVSTRVAAPPRIGLSDSIDQPIASREPSPNGARSAHGGSSVSPGSADRASAGALRICRAVAENTSLQNSSSNARRPESASAAVRVAGGPGRLLTAPGVASQRARG